MDGTKHTEELTEGIRSTLKCWIKKLKLLADYRGISVKVKSKVWEKKLTLILKFSKAHPEALLEEIPEVVEKDATFPLHCEK